jgi:ADP-ribose pyrophosphatase
MNDSKWQILNQENIIDHPFLRVDAQTIALPDGRVIPDWHWVHARDYVIIVAVDEQRRVLILDGYKHGVGRDNWQVVGGYLEAGEEPLPCAQRELQEEVGLAADGWDLLGAYVVDANRHVGVGSFFLAQGLRPVENLPSDDLEQATLHWVALPEIQQALGDGRVGALAHATALSLALLKLSEAEA